MDWKTMLAYITGSVDRELLLRNEYLVTENRILRDQLQGRLRLTDGERRTLAEIGKQLGKRALEEVARSTCRRASGDDPGLSEATAAILVAEYCQVEADSRS